MKVLTPPERLFVAADFRPPDFGGKRHPFPRAWVVRCIRKLAESLQGTGVCIKIGPVLSAYGDELVDDIHARGLPVCVDLKLMDIPNTLATYCAFLREVRPEYLTVMCDAGLRGLLAVKETLPEVEIWGVTVLTSQTDTDMEQMGRGSVDEAVFRAASVAADAGIGGWVVSPKEAPILSRLRYERNLRMTINTPNIRIPGVSTPCDDQNLSRSATPEEAFRLGADRIIVGRTITLAPDPYQEVMKILDMISAAGLAAD